MKFHFTLFFFIFLVGYSFAQVKPQNFPEETSPSNSNFEVYSQKNGINKRATLDNLKKYFAPQIYGTIGYVPTLTGNTANKMQFVIDPNLDRWYIDKDGVAFLLSRTLVGGDLSGSLPNPTVYKIQGRNIASTAPSNKQVLKWNATNNRWEPGTDSTGIGSLPQVYQLEALNPLPTQPIDRGSVALKKYDLNDNIEVYYSTGSAWVLAGKMLGVKNVDSLTILPGGIKNVHLGSNSVTGVKIQNATITGDKINDMGASPGNLLGWDGGAWGAVDPVTEPTGPATGDLDGYYPGPNVVALSGYPLDPTAPTPNQVLKWNGSAWKPQADATGSGITALTGDVTATGSGSVATTIANGAVTGEKINSMSAGTGQVLKWNGTTWAPSDVGLTGGIGNRLAYWTNTTSLGPTTTIGVDNANSRIGIGTTSPSYALDVVGSSGYIASDMGIDLQPVLAPVAPTGSATTGGSMTAGTHTFRVIYTTAIGQSDLSPGLAVTTGSGNNSVTLTIPVSTDSRVTGRKIFKSNVGQGDTYGVLVGTVADNTSTTWTYSAVDGTTSLYTIPNTTSNYVSVNGTRVFLPDQRILAFGYSAGNTSQTGPYNIYIGGNNATNVTTGRGNLIMGFSSCNSLTTGSDNVVIQPDGAGGTALSTGQRNIVFGRFAGAAIGSANDNIAIGYNAVKSTASYGNNIGIGFNALTALAGERATAIGYYAGASIVASGLNTNNVFLGANAGYHASQLTSAINAMALGANTYTTASNQIIFGDASVTTIGAGLFNPSAKLHIKSTGSTSSTYTAKFENSSGAAMMFIQDNGCVGVGVSTPSSRLQLPAGTATASTAPLKFTAGTNLSTAEAGAVEFDGAEFYATSATRQLLFRGFKGTATLDFPSVGPGANANLTVSDANAVAGDIIEVSNPFSPSAGLYFLDAGCATDGTIWVRYHNYSTGTTIDPSSANFKYRIIK